jgi:hypothetical protein
MSIIDNGTGSSASLVERVKAILLKPAETWDRIDGEPATVQGLYTGYICILAAIGPIASFIGGQVFGYGAFIVHIKPSLIDGLVWAIFGYVMSLVMVFVMALVIEALAPSFGGVKDRIQAFKVAAYAYTAAWVAAIFGLVPALALLGVLGGLYSLYLLYLGLPKLMKAPQDKALAYTAVAVVVAIVLSLVINGVMGMMGGAAMMGGRLGGFTGAAAPAEGTISFGGAKVDIGKLEQASKQMEATAKQMEASVSGVPGAAGEGVKAVPGETLKALLPAVAGYNRSEITSETNSVGGFSGSKAEARYEKGDARMTVEIVDMGAAGALAGLAGAVKVDHSKETATGYEKVSTTGGRIITEEYDRSAKSGKYGAMVGSRFAVEARGEQVAMNDLKGAVDAVNLAQLEALAR